MPKFSWLGYRNRSSDPLKDLLIFQLEFVLVLFQELA